MRSTNHAFIGVLKSSYKTPEKFKYVDNIGIAAKVSVFYLTFMALTLVVCAPVLLLSPTGGGSP